MTDDVLRVTSPLTPAEFIAAQVAPIHATRGAFYGVAGESSHRLAPLVTTSTGGNMAPKSPPASAPAPTPTPASSAAPANAWDGVAFTIETVDPNDVGQGYARHPTLGLYAIRGFIPNTRADLAKVEADGISYDGDAQNWEQGFVVLPADRNEFIGKRGGVIDATNGNVAPWPGWTLAQFEAPLAPADIVHCSPRDASSLISKPLDPSTGGAGVSSSAGAAGVSTTGATGSGGTGTANPLAPAAAAATAMHTQSLPFIERIEQDLNKAARYMGHEAVAGGRAAMNELRKLLGHVHV